MPEFYLSKHYLKRDVVAHPLQIWAKVAIINMENDACRYFPAVRR